MVSVPKASQDPAPLFTVIVPFLNEQRWLPGCIRSIQAQTLHPSLLELVFIDNGSTDRSTAIVEQHPAITLLRESRRDPYIARNRGIAAARGRYLAFLDADCMAEPDWLERMREEIDRSGAEIVLGYIAFPPYSTRLLHPYQDYYHRKQQYLFDHHLKANYSGNGGNMVVRADVFQQLGPFPPMPVVGDVEIIHRLIAHRSDAVIRYAPCARVVHAEVAGVADCLKKLYESGIHSGNALRIPTYQPVSFTTRTRILMDMLRERGALWGAALTAMLFLGWVSFAAGRAVLAWKRVFRTAGTPRAAGSGQETNT